MFDVILFDLDGTLTDSKEGIINCVKYALKSYGIEENDMSVLLRFIGPPLYDMFAETYGFSHERANEAVAKYRERFSDVGLFENALIDGAAELLEYLRKKAKPSCLQPQSPLFLRKELSKISALPNILIMLWERNWTELSVIKKTLYARR